MSFALRPVSYMPHSRGQAHRMSRPAEGSRARALGPALGGGRGVNQSLFSGAVGHRDGHVPRAGWGSWLCCSRSAVLVRAESGEPGQGDGEQGAPLQGPICGGYLGGWEQSAGWRQKPSPVFCVHPIPGHSCPSRPNWHRRMGETVQGMPAHHPLPAPTCRRLRSGSWLESGWSCRTGGCQLLKAWIAPSIEEGWGRGGLGWETLAQGTAPWGQIEKPLATLVASLYEQMENRMSARTGFWNGRYRVRNNKVRATVP